MKLALVIPTRGVIFARTIQSTILSPELPSDSTVHIVSGLPIPEAHNECIARALETDCTHILFVEEDMELPKHALTYMMEMARTYDIVAIDYPLTETQRSTIFYDQGKPLWTGFGCTMFSKRLFDEVLKRPWLTADNIVTIKEFHPFQYEVRNAPEYAHKAYGQYDIWFGLQMREKGIPIYVINEYKCNHLRMKSWERKSTNQGTHEIYEV